jgi:hypothetical protein
MQDKMHEATQGMVSVTTGMANAMCRGKRIARICNKCRMGIPRYVGRYPKTCPGCGAGKVVHASEGAVVERMLLSPIQTISGYVSKPNPSGDEWLKVNRLADRGGYRVFIDHGGKSYQAIFEPKWGNPTVTIVLDHRTVVDGKTTARSVKKLPSPEAVAKEYPGYKLRVEKHEDYSKRMGLSVRFESVDERMVLPPMGAFGIYRRDMPQIPSKAVPEYLSWLLSRGVAHKRLAVPVGKLRATQRDLNLAKAEKLTLANDKVFLKKPVLVSSDNYLLDGHHRWAALLNIDPNEDIEVIQINLQIKELLNLTHEFPKTEYKDIGEARSRVPRINNMLLAGHRVRLLKRKLTATEVPYGVVEKHVEGGREGLGWFLEESTKPGVAFRVEDPNEPVLIFEFEDSGLIAYSTNRPENVLGFDPREEMVEDAGWSREAGWADIDEGVDAAAAGERLDEAPTRASTERPATAGQGAHRVHGGFRYQLRANKNNVRKDVALSIQNKLNAKRGLARRIEAARKWHRSAKGQEMHKGLARYNTGNRRGEALGESFGTGMREAVHDFARMWGERYSAAGQVPPYAPNDDEILRAIRFVASMPEGVVYRPDFETEVGPGGGDILSAWESAGFLEKLRPLYSKITDKAREDMAGADESRTIGEGFNDDDPTNIDDVLDELLRRLIVIESLDVLQNVEFDDGGSIYLFFDPSLTRNEVDEVMLALQQARPEVQLVASPDQSLPNESVQAEWWVAFFPGDPVEEGASAAQADTTLYAVDGTDGAAAKVQMVVPATTSIDQIAASVDLAQLMDIGESRAQRWLDATE